MYNVANSVRISVSLWLYKYIYIYLFIYLFMFKSIILRKHLENSPDSQRDLKHKKMIKAPWSRPCIKNSGPSISIYCYQRCVLYAESSNATQHWSQTCSDFPLHLQQSRKKSSLYYFSISVSTKIGKIEKGTWLFRRNNGAQFYPRKP